jgi:O-antigen ligase
MTVVGASSRGGQIGLAFQGVWGIFKERRSLKQIIAVTTIAASLYFLLPEEQVRRFQSIGTDLTSEQRLLYWKHGLEMIQQHPVFGVGFYNFAPHYAARYPQDVLFQTAQLPHNIFIQVGTDAGLVGLLIFALILARNMECLRQVRRPFKPPKEEVTEWRGRISSGLSLATIGYVVAGQFVTVTYYPYIWINLAMSVALLNIDKSSDHGQTKRTK